MEDAPTIRRAIVHEILQRTEHRIVRWVVRKGTHEEWVRLKLGEVFIE